MKVVIDNLGVVKHATIDLNKNILLFCGPNNSGKTYIAYVLNALLSQSPVLRSVMNNAVMKDQNGTTYTISITKELIVEYLKLASSYLQQNMGSIFGLSEEMEKSFFRSFKLECIYDDADYKRFFNEKFSLYYQADDRKYNGRKAKNSSEITIEISTTSSSISDGVIYRSTIDVLLSSILRYVVYNKMNNCYMLPVERNSVYTFKTELSLNRNILIDQLLDSKSDEIINPFELVESRARRYPLAIRNSLRIASDIENIQKYKSQDFYDYAVKLEKQLLGGEVRVTKSGDVEFAPHQAKKKHIPIHVTSSIVKTLSSLVVYLKYLAKKNDVLIIDEPEINLHPSSQVVLARLLVRLTRLGIKMIISTHSDYIVREINNLIMAGTLVESGSTIDQNFTKIDKDELLNWRDIGVYEFSRNTRGYKFIATEANVEQTGFSISEIDNTIDMQNSESDYLSENLLILNNN